MSARAGAPELDSLLDQAQEGMDGTLKRIRQLLPDQEDESWELEREAFGLEDPKVSAARQAEEDKRAAAEPVVDRPARSSWRELFRKHWPEGPRKTRRPRR